MGMSQDKIDKNKLGLIYEGLAANLKQSSSGLRPPPPLPSQNQQQNQQQQQQPFNANDLAILAKALQPLLQGNSNDVALRELTQKINTLIKQQPSAPSLGQKVGGTVKNVAGALSGNPVHVVNA